MCSNYQMVTNVEAIRRLFKVTGPAPNLPLFPDIWPDREAPIIRADDTGERRIELARWGVPPPGGVSRPFTNVRNLASPFWRASLAGAARRCIVPVTAFAEWTVEPDPATGRKRKVWFARANGEPFVFAGVTRAGAQRQLAHQREGDGETPAQVEPLRFAFLTCAPNQLVGAVHPKAMPVVLTDGGIDAWLSGAPAESLACPCAEDHLAIVESALGADLQANKAAA